MAKANIQAAVEKADALVMEICAPEKMTPKEAIDFLDQLGSNLDGAIEALKEENDL